MLPAVPSILERSVPLPVGAVIASIRRLGPRQSVTSSMRTSAAGRLILAAPVTVYVGDVEPMELRKERRRKPGLLADQLFVRSGVIAGRRRRLISVWLHRATRHDQKADISMRRRLFAIAAVAASATIIPLAATAASAAPAAGKATGTVTWDYQGTVSGTVTFNANNKTGGTLDYQNSNGQWLHAVIDPGSYLPGVQEHSAVFTGVITSGSDDYTVGHAGDDYIVLTVVDNGTSGRNGDMIAVWANEGDAATASNTALTANNAGVVTSGNLTVF
jgi:hypothetical protein